MKLNFKLFKLSIIMMVSTIIISIFLTFFCHQYKGIVFLNDIFINLFGGTVILFVTSIIEYFSNRRKQLENLMKFILKYRNQFSKIKYLDEVKILTYDEYKKKFNIDDSNIELMFKTMDDCDRYNKSLMIDFDEIVDAYIDISQTNFNDFWDIYDDLHFIYKNKTNKFKLYEEVFKYVYDQVQLIRELSFHLNEYKKSGNNSVVMYDKIREYQKNIFYIKKVIKKLDKKNMELIKNGLEYEGIYKEGSSLFIYNKMCKTLDEQYNNIGKIVYFNKNYKN